MYLMHRISHNSEESVKLLEEGYLPIGWGDIRKNRYDLAEDFIKVAREKSKYDFGQYIQTIAETTEFSWLSPRQGYMLHNFFNLEKESIVIVPKSLVFDVYEVVDIPEVFSSEKTNLNDDNDIGFIVKVKEIYRDIPREKFLEASLISKLKYRGTNLVFSEQDEIIINKTLDNIKNNISIDNFAETKSQIVNSIQNYILTLGPDKFERLIKSYLESLGSDQAIIPSKSNKGDNNPKADIDVKASFKNLGIVIHVQAKHHNGISDATGLEQLILYENEIDNDFANLTPVKWFVTTAKLDEDAKGKLLKAYPDKEVELNNIKILAESDFAELLYDSGYAFSSEVFEK